MTGSCFSAMILCAHFFAGSAMPPVADIALYNPTAWDRPGLVEVPVGRIGAPVSIDWTDVHLECAGQVLPHAIREGRAHWNARLTAPVLNIRPEDLLVFSCAVPPGAWVHVALVPGRAENGKSELEEREGRWTVSYSDFRVAIDAKTGLLQECVAYGESLLTTPFSITPFRLLDPGYVMKGTWGVGYDPAAMEVHKDTPIAYQVKPVSQSSTPAMTELNFVLEPDQGPAMALTYRIHAMGLLEIVVDERPWTGETPWLRFAMEYALSFQGDDEPLPFLESRWQFYGFHDYTASVKNVARLHYTPGAGVLELGEEPVNGRKYLRRLFAFPGDEKAQGIQLAEWADEGFVVEIMPIRANILDRPVWLSHCEEGAIASQVIVNALQAAGVEMVSGSQAPQAQPVRLEISAENDAAGLEGDGYAIQADPAGGVSVRSGTRLGLYNAARAITRHLRRFGKEGGIPLIVSNPVVALRAGGFGGGDFEVDFPYGTDEQWQKVFDGLIDSGMNVFACLGMWGNWKMPVGYQYMPELRSDAPDAYDESSGAKFAELDQQREHGLKLARYLRDRGARVWLWIPIGCVPTTFAQRYPEAMAPGSNKIPCFTHPEYQRYIDAFFKELLETYPLDGFVLIRDDNGGICTCDRCKEYIGRSRTQSAVWEQYLVIYNWLRTHGFSGEVGAYPYGDFYEPRLDPLLPDDFYIIGHGAGGAVLSRRFDRIGPMGDTWLDNLYANFRIPPSPRMRRLISDRGGFWIGGAYCGTELPWESIGYFGWEPTATPNTLRYDWGHREFSKEGALAFLRMDDAYEHLWDINALYMPPADWIKLTPDRRTTVMKEGQETVEQFRSRLADLKAAVDPGQHPVWFEHVDLFAPYFEYHLNRLDRFAAIYEKILANREALNRPEGLPKDVRDAVLADYSTMYGWAAKYEAVMQGAPDGMLGRCRHMTKPYKEWMAGYDQFLGPRLEIPQFAGEATVETDSMRPGESFGIRIAVRNQGVCPWISGAGQSIEFSGIAEQLGLPAIWEYTGDPIAPGDHRVLTFQGKVPQESGEGELTVTFLSPFRVPEKFITQTVKLSWK